MVAGVRFCSRSRARVWPGGMEADLKAVGFAGLAVDAGFGDPFGEVADDADEEAALDGVDPQHRGADAVLSELTLRVLSRHHTSGDVGGAVLLMEHRV